MPGLNEIDKLKLERIFEMSGGYVLRFSDPSFQSFVFNTVGIDINEAKYQKYGTSKAKKLRGFWEIQDVKTVGKLTESLLLYYKELATGGHSDLKYDQALFDQCLTIAMRLQGQSSDNSAKEVTVGDFLRKEVDEVSISSIDIDSSLIVILEQRMVEVKKCLKSEAFLSVVFLCGSILEGILLGIASKRNIDFNKASSSPKEKSNGKVKHFPDWTLSNFIDVAYELQLLGLDVKKFSHTLRDFRNYIHPYQQMASGFNPDYHTAKISWQVLKAALFSLKQSNLNRVSD